MSEIELKAANKFRLGADPEFALLDSEGFVVIGPGSLLPSNSVERESNQLGSDMGLVLELRPKPAKTAYELVARMRGLLRSPGLERASRFRWRAGGYAIQRGTSGGNRNVALGGHIHFSTGAFTRGVVNFNDYSQFPAFAPLQELTRLAEHLDILPEAESATRRRSNYGSDQDAIRASTRSWEYRKMCSWLFHPRVAFTMLSLAKLCLVEPRVCLEALKGKTSFDAFRSLVDAFKSEDDDARRLHERVFPKGLDILHLDPTVDFRNAWARWRPEPFKNPPTVEEEEAQDAARTVSRQTNG